jgi:DNA-binding MarR family transcriptional regulator
MNRSEYQRAVHDLALFRYNLRKFLRFDDNAPRECGTTARQYHLMLGVAGFTGTWGATISQLAEFLQEKHNSVVGLVDRAEQSGLVRRRSGSTDRRVVCVSLTLLGEETLVRVCLRHRREVKRLSEALPNFAGERKPWQLTARNTVRTHKTEGRSS